MKVLYVSSAKGPDYQCDMLFHGLRTLLGPDVVDFNRLDFMYKGFFKDWPWYTLYALLNPEPEADRSDIEAKIRNKFFDVIIYGSVLRDRQFLPLVLEHYPHDRVAFVDGEDEVDTSYIGYERIPVQNLHPWEAPGLTVPRDCPYFKRELTEVSRAFPISFAIPKEKIVDPIPQKIRLMAPCDPRDRSTFIYSPHLQAEYYRQYGESYFGFTRKQGGWDCVRHYEIMASGTIPYFDGLENCPVGTMFFMPKLTLLEARELHNRWSGSSEDNDRWWDMFNRVRVSLLNNLTTDALAKYVLEKVLT
jgi:hypothetical protein